MTQMPYPRQVMLVTSRDHIDGETKDNIFTLSWHMPVSFNPNLYSICISKKRFSYNLIKNSRVFVVNFMPYHLKDEVLYCGSYSGRFIDKFKETGLIKEEAEKIDCCRIKQALGYLECEVVNEIEAGDHVIIIGKVVYSEEKEEGKKIFQLEKGSHEFTTTGD